MHNSPTTAALTKAIAEFITDQQFADDFIEDEVNTALEGTLYAAISEETSKAFKAHAIDLLAILMHSFEDGDEVALVTLAVTTVEKIALQGQQCTEALQAMNWSDHKQQEADLAAAWENKAESLMALLSVVEELATDLGIAESPCTGTCSTCPTAALCGQVPA